MGRIEDIQSRVDMKAGSEGRVGSGGMRIPGMKIGTQIAPGGPTFEDVMFLIDKVQKCKAFISTANYSNKEDMEKARVIFNEIESGR